ncbi:uncharacterized protein YbjT (DUF2867 family) [Kitasatospora sp. MAA4]|uniref:NAD(P)H-binding protein n=1 Tax=Kitasatospora sp. MAA4 TaxID=3035093 RepID=UPI00247516F1|nr:NAD(P)H-binding protein [Kitasatospora sp. MAA4]MDH6130717.1 uncharacterized protein YbjT (DUF2867 family) [Kitasatospora sp. MAA4]
MILVTGATGTVGSLVVSALRSQGREVRAMVRKSTSAPASWDEGVHPVVADFEDAASLDAAVAGVEAVYLLVGVDPRMAEHECQVIDAAVRSGGRPKVVLHAAAGVDLRPEGVRFVAAHVTAFDHLQASGLEWTVLAPGGFFQGFLGMAGSVKAGSIALPAGAAAVSYVDAADIAEVAAHVLTTDGHTGRVYTVTGPQALTHTEIADQLGDVAGRAVNYLAATADQARAALLAAGLDEWRVDGLIELYGLYAAGHASKVSDAVPVLLGRPARTFAEFAAANGAVFRSS